MKGNAIKQADSVGRSRIWDGEYLTGRILGERRGVDLAHIRPEMRYIARGRLGLIQRGVEVIAHVIVGSNVQVQV